MVYLHFIWTIFTRLQNYSEDMFSGSHSIYDNNLAQGWSGGNMGACPLRLEEIVGLLVPTGKAYTTTDWPCDCCLTAQVLACPGKVVSCQTIHTYKS